MGPTKKFNYSLFEVTGIELEYMIVDNETLAVKPFCDKLLTLAAGTLVAEYQNGNISWCNEIVNHQVELKTTLPVSSISGLSNTFHDNILSINQMLRVHGAMLLPTGMHPLMNPLVETRLWEHHQSEVYELYNSIFDCRGHGWSNLQSTHVNLPFSNDEEFGRLHAALRLVLPLVPALAASSPLVEGAVSGFVDTRLEVYRRNQERIPSIVGSVIPEAVFTRADYHQKIFDPIIRDISPFDPKGILEHHFVNSRGAIARFDRGAIEVRLIDIQECPRADVAIAAAIIALTRALVEEEFIPLNLQEEWEAAELLEILLATIKDGENARILDRKYLKIWGLTINEISAGKLWDYLVPLISKHICPGVVDDIKFIIDHGTLSSRVIKALNSNLSQGNIKRVYHQLAGSLMTNTMYNPLT